MGTIYLDEKEGEYTQEDEEILVMFASQAAMVIANARRYRDEQRARARLETLVDTSPVGVAVFDARTGAPISFNREGGADDGSRAAARPSTGRTAASPYRPGASMGRRCPWRTFPSPSC